MSTIEDVIDALVPCLIPITLLLNSTRFKTNLSPLYHLVTAGVTVSTLVVIIQRFFFTKTLSARLLALWTLLASATIVPLGASLFMFLSGKAIPLDVSISKTLANLTPAVLTWGQCLFSLFINETLRTEFTRKSSHGERMIIVQCLSTFAVLFASTRTLPLEYLEMSLNNRVLIEIGGMCLTSIPTLYISKKLTNLGRLPTTIFNYTILIAHLTYTYKIIADLVENSPIIWMTDVIFETQERLHLFRYWLMIMTVTSMFATIWSRYQSGSNSVMRKFFHLAIIVIFLSGYERDFEFLLFAGGCTLAAFILVEIIRVSALEPVGPLIERTFSKLRSKSDDCSLTLGHIYLLTGFFLPIWLIPPAKPTSNNAIVYLSGPISVGFGDSAAAIIGSMFGSHKWPKSDKTIEGTLAAFIVQNAFGCLWVKMDPFVQFQYMIVCAVTSLSEAFIGSYDNISLPIFMTAIMVFMK